MYILHAYKYTWFYAFSSTFFSLKRISLSTNWNFCSKFYVFLFLSNGLLVYKIKYSRWNYVNKLYVSVNTLTCGLSLALRVLLPLLFLLSQRSISDITSWLFKMLSKSLSDHQGSEWNTWNEFTIVRLVSNPFIHISKLI